MKLLHLSDLHLGKRVNEFSMLEDQKYILNQILQIVINEQVNTVLIAGDVYDKSVPSAQAVTLFDDFLTRLEALECTVLLIAGNHDSPERLAFGAHLLQKSRVYLSPVFDGRLTCCTLNDEYGELDVWLMPFLKPSVVRPFYPEDTMESYQDAAAVVLATGHSARDIYHMLYDCGVRLEAKPFAMGVRIEHPQALIDSIQYHMPSRGEYLPAASYSLVTQQCGRGVYSFCMCPGGFIVPAMTDSAQSVVNGMSPSARNSAFANSGIVTEVRPEDFAYLREEWGELAGLRFQEEFERAARRFGGEHQIAPAQRVADFVAGRRSSTLPRTSYIPGITPSLMTEWMPAFIGEALRAGLADFGRRMRGFVTNEAIVVGVESRTSSPVRIPRDPERLMHPEIEGLFPAGEGAGYAGGIISAALDGERIADSVARYVG